MVQTNVSSRENAYGNDKYEHTEAQRQGHAVVVTVDYEKYSWKNRSNQ